MRFKLMLGLLAAMAAFALGLSVHPRAQAAPARDSNPPDAQVAAKPAVAVSDFLAPLSGAFTQRKGAGTIDIWGGQNEPNFAATAYLKLNGGARCSGVLLGPRKVVTAGHCVANKDGCNITPIAANQFTVFFGPNGTLGPYAVFRVRIHPNYSPCIGHDLAILDLMTDVTQATPAHVAPLGDLGNHYRAVGYGGPSLGTRRSVDWNVISEGAGLILGNGFTSNPQGGICGGDSGGPLFVRDDQSAVPGAAPNEAEPSCGNLGAPQPPGAFQGHKSLLAYAGFLQGCPPGTTCPPETACSNGLDDDNDGFIDMLDLDCSGGGGGSCPTEDVGQGYNVTFSDSNVNTGDHFKNYQAGGITVHPYGNDYNYAWRAPFTGHFTFTLTGNTHYPPPQIFTPGGTARIVLTLRDGYCSSSLLQSGAAASPGVGQVAVVKLVNVALNAGQQIGISVDGDPDGIITGAPPRPPLAGTFTLRIDAAAEAVPDQTNPCSTFQSAAVTGTTKKSQTFHPGFNGRLTKVVLSGNLSSGATSVELQSAANNVPSGQVIATGTYAGNNTWTFNSQSVLYPQFQYAIVASNPTGSYDWDYSQGESCYLTGSSATWFQDQGQWVVDVEDFKFTTWMIPQ